MEYKIYVGTKMKIHNGFLKKAMIIMYCGMSSEKVFVLAPLLSSGYSGFSPSIYFNADSKEIQILNQGFGVIEVTPEYIILAD